MTRLIGYIPREWHKERITRNMIKIHDETRTAVCTIEHPHDDDRAEINADLIAAIPAMLRALRSIEEYAKVCRPTAASIDELGDWATQALEAANWKE